MLLPNVLAGWFNYTYNHNWFLQEAPEAEATFKRVSWLSNGIAFPLGLLVGIYIVWPLTTALRQRLPDNPADRAARPAAAIRILSLRLGRYLATLGMILWIVAGFAFPLAVYLYQVPLTAIQYLHFFGSLAMCGCIAAAYPFFFTTALAVRFWYPALVGGPRISAADVAECTRLRSAIWRYLAAGGTLPMLGVMLLVIFRSDLDRGILTTLSLIGLLGFFVIFGLVRQIQSNLSALEATAR